MNDRIYQGPFAVGEVVTLKSGGPRMVVASLSQVAKCQWFDQLGRLKEYTFNINQLVKVADDGK